MEKLMIKNRLKMFGFVRIAIIGLGFPLTMINACGQTPATGAQPAAGAAAPATAGTAEAERVIVTGSNITTAEEVGPNPVLSLNRDLIEKSGERQAAELLRNL